ncbi:MAG: hypothetical protein ACE5GI_08350 [Candidatus Aminicenantales bacterium]
MIWWVMALVVLTVLSYLADVGVLTFLQELKIPGLSASILSILILLCTAGILARMLVMAKKGEKEALNQKISELEGKLTPSEQKEE